MTLPNNRDELKKYCLRRLGHPAIQINVTPQQIDDRINDALAMFFQYHNEGVEERYAFLPITDEVIANGYFSLSEEIEAITKIVPTNWGGGGLLDRGIFDVSFQIHQSELFSSQGIYKGGSLIYLDMVRSHLALINRMFNYEKTFHFNKHTHRLYVEDNLTELQERMPGGGILIHCYIRLDMEGSDAYTSGWTNIWLRAYATALIKRQWGENLSKFTGVPLLSGVNLNGENILSQALQEIEKLENELYNTWQSPVDFFIG